MKDQWSSWHEVWSGVPQGSVLGPLLFLIYINDLEVSVSGEVFTFADDTKIVRQVGDRMECDDMQRDLDIMVEWADRWQMEFNVDKCKVMHIGKKKSEVSILHERECFEGSGSRKGFRVSNKCRP